MTKHFNVEMSLMHMSWWKSYWGSRSFAFPQHWRIPITAETGGNTHKQLANKWFASLLSHRLLVNIHSNKTEKTHKRTNDYRIQWARGLSFFQGTKVNMLLLGLQNDHANSLRNATMIITTVMYVLEWLFYCTFQFSPQWCHASDVGPCGVSDTLRDRFDLERASPMESMESMKFHTAASFLSCSSVKVESF